MTILNGKVKSEQQAKINVSAQDVVAAVVIPENIEQRISEKKPLFDIIVQTKTEDYLALLPAFTRNSRV